MAPTRELRTLLEGVAFGESPRWHDGRLWVADWGRRQIVALDPEGRSENVVQLDPAPFQPICFDWRPDGRMLVVSSRERRLLRREPDGSLVTYADLTGVIEEGLNEVVVDGRGNAYVNGAGFDAAAGGEFAPGMVALVTPDGSVSEVAAGVAFPNGMAVTPDNSTLIVAESYGRKLTGFDIAADGNLSNRRVWADAGEGVPDGICIDAEGAVWYGDVPNRRCVRVREGGGVLDTIELGLGCFACMLGGPDGSTLFILAQEWRGPAAIGAGSSSGQVLAVQAPAPHAGWP